MKKDVERHLFEKIIPFWNKLVDNDHGGFYGYVSNNHEIDLKAPKGLVQQSRILWTYSALNNRYPGIGFSEKMHHAYAFLIKAFYRKNSRGFIWEVNHDGSPRDERFVTYGQCFALYALTEYYRSTGNGEVLELQRETFDQIERKSYDPEINGYVEEFDKSWARKENTILSDGIGNTAFTANTLIHILEAYTNYYSVKPEARILNAIVKVVEIARTRFIDHDSGGMWMYLDGNWQPLVRERHYGHEIEFSWLLHEAMEVTGIKNPVWDRLSLNLGMAALKSGWNGKYLENTSGNNGKDNVWWVAAEAMAGIMHLYLRTKNESHLVMLEQLWNTIKEDIVDDDPEGEWFWYGKSAMHIDATKGMAEFWKTPYHNCRSLLAIIKGM